MILLRVEGVQINNINSISHLNLSFHSGVNILCGTNGIGKTTILDCISNSYMSSTSRIRKKVHTDTSRVELTMLIDGEEDSIKYSLSEEEKAPLKGLHRRFIYHRISQRQQDRPIPLRVTEEGSLLARSSYDAMKSWFFRCYFKKKNMTEEKLNNFKLTKKVFNKLDPKVTFEEANEKIVKMRFRDREYKAVEILLKTPHGIIDMDFLSSGYKACFNILFGIIRSIEERTKVSVEDFDDLVLIDEIDLHLHPEWQTKILDILKWLIPKAQIIITTHSPHVIQNAKQGEIIPLGIDEEGRAYVRDLPDTTEYGFQGWTIEEILSDVMGLNNTHSELYYELLSDFDMALNDLDIHKATHVFEKIDKLLHPDNHLRKVFKIQLGSLGGLDID